ncbi:MAG TPA: histidine kinase [Telluria sp.]|nr:histidine kinase [Telluria sp.]
MTTSTVFAGINQLELERARIAQDIHDELGGVLTGLKACIAVAIERAARAGLPANPLLDDASALAGAAFDAVRRIATNLHPAVIDLVGLWAALASQVSALARRSDMGCEYLVDSGLAALDLGRERELAVFRIAQEALANVERHARASAVSLRVVRDGRWLCLTVADDGIGIGPQRGGASLGIRGMRQRALACKGSLTVCAHGAGTVLRLVMPLGECDGD